MAISDELRKQVDPNNESCCEHCLSSKCKEWAYSTYGIMIQSYPYCGKGRADALKGLEVDEVFKENTELEAIIKACEWVLKNEIEEENRLQLQEDLVEYNKLIKGGL